jgi:multisubunit Na+/H+ antiporter MnhF subunit
MVCFVIVELGIYHLNIISTSTGVMYLLGICTLWKPYMDVTMTIFLMYFLNTRKINK